MRSHDHAFADEAEELDHELKALTLDLFTEIAILEHLVRNREPEIGELDPAEFGILNYFCRMNYSEARISLLSWCFQETEARTRELVATLADGGLVTVTDEADGCVRVTDAGREKHMEILKIMAPTFIPIVEDIPREDLEVTVRTLMELRRTFDNLPDR